jgi:hypothetical protein
MIFQEDTMKRLVAATAIALFVTTPVLAQTSESMATAAPAPAAAATAPIEAAPAPLPAPAEAAPPAADPNVYQVLRVGDRDMSCEQLSAEANYLNAKLLSDQKTAANARAGRAAGGAVAGGAMRAAGRFGINRLAGRFGPMGFAVAHAANDAVSQAAAENIARGGEVEGAVTPEQQRMNHLLGLYKSKSC